MVASVALFGWALSGCQGDAAVRPACDDALTWSAFGEPFFRSWCTGCHSAALAAADRQGAPVGVDFDDLATVRAWSDEIDARAVADRTMPPALGPDDDDLTRLHDWLSCGAPGEDAADPPPVEDTDVRVTGCDRAGTWVLSGATCDGDDITASWAAMFPVTELRLTADDGTCAIDYHLADAGCDEHQLWHSDFVPPSSSFDFEGTVSCAPTDCSWAAIPSDVCTVAEQSVVQQVGVTDLGGGQVALGPLAPPDLASFCGDLGLVFQQVSP